MPRIKGKRLSSGIACLALTITLCAFFALRQRLTEGWLIFRLGASDAETRAAAADALGARRSVRAIPRLVDLLREEPGKPPYLPSHGRALIEIGRQAAPALIGLLSEALQRDSAALQASATFALLRLGDDAVADLTAAIADPDQGRRQAAVHAFAAMDAVPVAAAPRLFGALFQGAIDLRLKAASALGKLAPFSHARSSHTSLGAFAAQMTPALLVRQLGQPLGAAREQAIKQCESLLRDNPSGSFDSAPYLTPLLGALDDADEAVRDAALGALCSLKAAAADATPALVSRLESADVVARCRAIAILSCIGQSASGAVPALSLSLADASPKVRLRAAQALGSFRHAASAASAELLDASHDDDKFVRIAVLIALPGVVEASAGVPVLDEALSDAEPIVRSNAAMALGDYGPAAGATVERLVALLGDEAPTVRNAAACALAKIGPGAEAAIPALLAALEASPPGIDIDCAFAALGAMGPAAVPALVEHASAGESVKSAAALKTLQRAGPFVEEQVIDLFYASDAESRPRVAGVLARLSPVTPGAVPALSMALDDHLQAVRTAAAGALVALGAIDATLPQNAIIFLEALHSPSPLVQERAAAALQRMGAAALVPLVGPLRKREPDVRARLARELGSLGEEAEIVIPALLRLLDDETEVVRSSACQSLSRMPLGPEEARKLVARLEYESVGVRDCVDRILAGLAWQEKSGVTAETAALGAAGAEMRTTVSGDRQAGDPAILDDLAQPLGDTDPAVRRKAAQRIGAIGGQARPLVPRLLSCLRDDEDAGVRVTCLGALLAVEQDGSQLLAAALGVIEDADAGVREAATGALASLGPAAAPAIPALTRRLEDRVAVVRAAAAMALGAVAAGREDVVPSLAAALRADDSPEVRFAAVRALLELGPAARGAVSTLKDATFDDSPFVGSAAEEALRNLEVPFTPRRSVLDLDQAWPAGAFPTPSAFGGMLLR